jgi:hypothetical protein
MLERSRNTHALSWAGIGLAGAAVVVACFLPTFEIAIEASIGAGSEQRSFRYSRALTLAGDLRPFGLLPLAAGLALVGAAVAGLHRGTWRWLVVASFVLASALAILVFDTEDRRLGWTGDAGVVGYEEPNGGPLFQPALDDLHTMARRSPEAREAGWELGGENWYAARGLDGWRIFLWSSLALVWLTGYRLARLQLRPAASTALVVSVTAAVLVWLVVRALSGLS